MRTILVLAGARLLTWGWLLLALSTLVVPPCARGDDRVFFTSEHLDLRISYDPARTNLLDILVADEDSQPERLLALTNAVLVVVESARSTLPGDFPPLGVEGDPLWVLPASQVDGTLHLGVSGEEIPPGTFAGPLVLRLLEVRGPGLFFLWQSDLGALKFFMNSRDGIDAADVFPQPAGGHGHADWGFTTSGVYSITFQAEARRAGESTNIVSPPRTATFHVLPLPPVPQSAFERWQAAHWPGVTDDAIRGGEADPDGDGLVNLWEFALGGDPRQAGGTTGRLPEARMIGTGADARVEVELVTASVAGGIEIELWTAERLTGPWSAVAAVATATEDGKGGVMWVLRDPRPVAGITNAFYRAGIRLIISP